MSPKAAILSAAGASIRVPPGTYCTTESRDFDRDGYVLGMCADTAEPTEPPRPRLEVAPGSRVRARFRDNRRIDDEVERLSAWLVHVDEQGMAFLPGRIEVHHVPTTRRWKLTLPARLRGANGLYLFVRYKNRSGDADFLAGLKPR
jgi:hypothetical protein